MWAQAAPRECGGTHNWELNVLVEQQHPKLERISMCLREGREVAAGAGWNCSCCCVSGDGLQQARVVSQLFWGYRCVAEGGESNCSTPGSSLVLPALLAPQYFHAERNSEVWVTWPLGNDAERHQRCF